MPLYDYRCQTCGTVFEVRQKFEDAPLTVHEGCGGVVERLLSTPALQFKGSGFYITDYNKSGGTVNGGTKPGEGGAKAGDGAAKTDSGSSTSTAASTTSSTASTDSAKK